MVLLSTLAIGMLSLSAVTMRQSGQSNEASRARANARLAVMMAIGQLQKNAGDDRRITVAADQLKGSADGSTSAAADGRRHWTGVYKSWVADTGNDPSAWPDRPSPEFLGWLVTESSGIASEAAAKSADVGDIPLVGKGTVGSDSKLHVKVPMIEAADRKGGKGALAWWTGDQGVKATMALPPSEPADSLAAARAGIQAVATNDFQSAGGGGIFPKIKLQEAKVASLSSWNQLSHVSAGLPAKRKELFHDIAAVGSGLLTDVRRGVSGKTFPWLLKTNRRHWSGARISISTDSETTLGSTSGSCICTTSFPPNWNPAAGTNTRSVTPRWDPGRKSSASRARPMPALPMDSIGSRTLSSCLTSSCFLRGEGKEH